MNLLYKNTSHIFFQLLCCFINFSRLCTLFQQCQTNCHTFQFCYGQNLLSGFTKKRKTNNYFSPIFNPSLLAVLQDTVSVHRPKFYAERFQSFMAKTVFKKIPSRMFQFPNSKLKLGVEIESTLLSIVVVNICKEILCCITHRTYFTYFSHGGGIVHLSLIHFRINYYTQYVI